jgi:hypothetical protein
MEKQDGQMAHATIITSSRNLRNVEQFINSP